ncbi:ribonuclease Z [Prochlorococcus marinus]|uniref:ribonuclease Z n=1 Tax=Prochlorococcus marinus TaxID=1219 RepID=UPI0022B5AB04|nr:ribonuclease Z [Prochlorococcus marinus]
MQVTFLGTSSGVPTLTRNVSAMVLKPPQRSDLWLFDCGEGTQHQFIRSNLKLSQIKKIFITHMHGDHVYGLPGLLASIGLAGSSSGIELYGPEPLKNFIDSCLFNSSSRLSYSLKFHKVENSAIQKEILFEDSDLEVKAAPLKHRIPSFAYRVDQKSRPGRFNIDKAKSQKIPPGPVYAALQRGEEVRLEDGRTFSGKEFCGPSRTGISLVYCTDTVYTESAIEISREADLLIHEATYAYQETEMAYQRGHSTATMAAQIAAKANVNQLILTHLSPRYTPGNETSPNDLLNEAKAIFPNTQLAKDFLQIDLKKRCNSS